MRVFETAGIDKRSLSKPLEWFKKNKSFQEKNDAYIELALELSARAIEKLLESNSLAATDIDHLLFVSTTGLATPSIDARLIGRLGFRSNVRRTPIWGLGCAGGALGLDRARDILLGAPQAKLILINVELCSLTFSFHDFSKSNLVATALFSDAVTAALLSGADSELAGAEMIDSDETTWPDSLDVMGWNLRSDGMQVVFSERIPRIVEENMRECVDTFLQSSSAKIEDVAHILLHPGGRKVLEAYCKALEIAPERLEISCDILRKYGNCSSATVMLVLEEFLRRKKYQPGDLALISALGPGFSAGNVLLEL